MVAFANTKGYTFYISVDDDIKEVGVNRIDCVIL